MRALVIGFVLALAACSDVTPWECEDDTECVRDEEQGTCTTYYYCAYPDETCAGSMLRYDDTAGDDLEDVCVGNEEL